MFFWSSFLLREYLCHLKFYKSVLFSSPHGVGCNSSQADASKNNVWAFQEGFLKEKCLNWKSSSSLIPLGHSWWWEHGGVAHVPTASSRCCAEVGLSWAPSELLSPQTVMDDKMISSVLSLCVLGWLSCGKRRLKHHMPIREKAFWTDIWCLMLS